MNLDLQKTLISGLPTDPVNATSVYAALKEFGAPLMNLTAKDFSQEQYYYQMGCPPLRIDVMMSIPGLTFKEAWKNRETIDVGGVEMSFISKSDLILAKKASGRTQDTLDVRHLCRED